jgi:hypothetical protein
VREAKMSDDDKAREAILAERAAYMRAWRRKSREMAAAKRHPVHRKMHHRDVAREFDRALTTLAGICDWLDTINPESIDKERAGQWASDLRKYALTISKFSRSIK